MNYLYRFKFPTEQLPIYNNSSYRIDQDQVRDPVHPVRCDPENMLCAQSNGKEGKDE